MECRVSLSHCSSCTETEVYCTSLLQILQVLLHLNLQHVEEPVNQLGGGGGGGGGGKKKLTQRQKRLEKQKMNRKQRRVRQVILFLF